MAAVPTADDMSLQEIARTVSDFRQEFRSQVAQLMRADVYRAEQAADRARITTLEKDAERRESERNLDRRMVLAAFIGEALSLIGSLVIVLATRH